MAFIKLLYLIRGGKDGFLTFKKCSVEHRFFFVAEHRFLFENCFVRSEYVGDLGFYRIGFTGIVVFYNCQSL